MNEVKNNLFNYLSFSVASSFKFGNDLLHVSGFQICNQSNFEDLFSNLSTLALSIFFLALRSLVRWRKLLISLLFREKSTSIQRYVFGISLNLFTGKNGECCAICVKLSVCWIATVDCTYMCATGKRFYVLLCILIVMN